METGSTLLKEIFNYCKDFETLILVAGELAEKRTPRDELSKLVAAGDSANLSSLNGSKHLTLLSRFLGDYGFSQTYLSFENASSLFLADYERTEDAVSQAVNNLEQSALSLYVGKTGTDLLWCSHETNDPSWAKLAEMLTECDERATDRRKFYLKRITELASCERLAGVTSPDKYDEIASSLSPVQLETDFVTYYNILPEVLSLHGYEARTGH